MKQPPFKHSEKSFFNNLSPAAWLTFVYITISALWILLSDKLAANIAGSDMSLLAGLQQKKGLFFVFLTGLVIYLISRNYLRSLTLSSKKYKGLEENYYALNEAAREGFFDCNLQTMTANLNKKMQFFIPGSGNTLQDFWEVYQKRIAAADIPRLKQEYKDILSAGKKNWITEYHLLGSDNKYYNVICSIYIITGPDNKHLRLVGAIQDVSDLRNLQQEYYKEQISNKQHLATSIIEAQETEKNRWAEELHDNVCQLLSVAKLNLSAIDSMPDSSATLSAEAKKLVTASITEIRNLSASLKPPVFEDILLEDSLDSLTKNISQVKDIAFTIDTSRLDESHLTDAQKVLIYRVVQEQLTNITKHSEATVVEIVIGCANDICTIEVKDNGKGFNAEKHTGGIGLRNIQGRLQVYKGNMEVASFPGKGSVLTATFSTEKTEAL